MLCSDIKSRKMYRRDKIRFGKFENMVPFCQSSGVLEWAESKKTGFFFDPARVCSPVEWVSGKKEYLKDPYRRHWR